MRCTLLLGNIAHIGSEVAHKQVCLQGPQLEFRVCSVGFIAAFNLEGISAVG